MLPQSSTATKRLWIVIVDSLEAARPAVVLAALGHQRDIADPGRAGRLAPHHGHDCEALFALGKARGELQQFRAHGLIVSLLRECW